MKRAGSAPALDAVYIHHLSKSRSICCIAAEKVGLPFVSTYLTPSREKRVNIKIQYSFHVVFKHKDHS
jgi:hypothetical protein